MQLWVGENLLLHCILLEGKLWVNSVANSTQRVFLVFRRHFFFRLTTHLHFLFQQYSGCDSWHFTRLLEHKTRRIKKAQWHPDCPYNYILWLYQRYLLDISSLNVADFFHQDPQIIPWEKQPTWHCKRKWKKYPASAPDLDQHQHFNGFFPDAYFILAPNFMEIC